MIELTKMNQEKFYVNPMLIEIVEVTPDRLITLSGDKKYYVLETVEEITEKMENFYRRIYSFNGKEKVQRAK